MANATPLNEASSVDMWADPHPPRTPNSDWSKVRDVLFHNFQGDLKEMSKCMNNAQEAYLRQKDTVGNKGRQFAELCATHLLGEKYNPKAKYEPLNGKIQRLRTANTHSATVLADLTSLLRLGNVASHPMTFPPAEKPTCIDAMYRLATTVIPKSVIVKSQTLEEFLAQLSLTKYLPAFEAQGALTVDDLHGVEKADFRQEFGMGLFEANRLFKAIGEREEDTREEEKKEEETTKNSFLTADRVDCVQVLKGHTATVWGVAVVSEDVVVSGSGDGTVRVWNWKTGKELQVLKGHTNPVWRVAVVSEDVVVSGSGYGTVRVWNWKTGEELQVLEGHTKCVYGVAKVSEDVVVSGSRDKTVRVWNWKSGKELQVLKGHTATVWGVAVVSEDVVVSGSDDGTVRVWNWKTGKELQVLKGHTSYVRGVAVVSEDVVVSGSGDKTVRVWNWKSGKELQVLRGHTSFVNAFAVVSEDVVVSGSDDKTVRVWKVVSSKK